MDGMEELLQGGRDEMRGFRGRAGFTIFASIFTGSFCVFACVCWFGFWVGVVCWVFSVLFSLSR